MSFTILKATHANIVRKVGFYPGRRQALKVADLIVRFATADVRSLTDFSSAQRSLVRRLTDALEGNKTDLIWRSTFADRFSDIDRPLDHLANMALVDECFSLADLFSDWYMGDVEGEFQFRHEEPVLGFSSGCRALIFFSVRARASQGDSDQI